jgi:spoIIIJ-associated protein
MTREFEGKTEMEAIEKASQALGLSIDAFSVEVISEPVKRGLFFKKSTDVRIRVHIDLPNEKTAEPQHHNREIQNDIPQNILDQAQDFILQVIAKMGYDATLQTHCNAHGKWQFDIVTEDSAILIGKQGKNLDALQVVLNAYLSNIEENESYRVILDSQDYRQRREELIVRQAMKSAQIVMKNKSSQLLEPMHPSDRRLVHTTLNQYHDIITQSEGTGLYKQVRIIYKGSR